MLDKGDMGDLKLNDQRMAIQMWYLTDDGSLKLKILYTAFFEDKKRKQPIFSGTNAAYWLNEGTKIVLERGANIRHREITISEKTKCDASHIPKKTEGKTADDVCIKFDDVGGWNWVR
jgi:hypothetical protein